MFFEFRDSPEYEARLRKPFTPLNLTLKEIHDAVPKHLLRKNGTKAAFYVLRDIAFSAFLYKFASMITPWSQSNFGGIVEEGWTKTALKSALWMSYWWMQGMVMTGIFCLGHDAGHKSLFNSDWANDIVGFVIHSYILIPFFAWRYSHGAHHKATASMERDENYVPYTRSSYKLPDEKTATKADYLEMFDETPFMALFRIFIMQGFGWWLYLGKNAMGSPMYPPGTNHFDPDSPLFKPEQRRAIVISNIGIIITLSILTYLGPGIFFRYYCIPYILVNHWIVLITYLQHSDPTVPHYRKGAWSFIRGATATIDRPLLGWFGRFFFHNVSHDHVAHHFFLRAPFFNGPEITKALKSVLKDDYVYDSTSSFYALYRSFTQCVFIEDEGDIVFYKNKYGQQARQLKETVETQKEEGSASSSSKI